MASERVESWEWRRIEMREAVGGAENPVAVAPAMQLDADVLLPIAAARGESSADINVETVSRVRGKPEMLALALTLKGRAGPLVIRAGGGRVFEGRWSAGSGLQRLVLLFNDDLQALGINWIEVASADELAGNHAMIALPALD